MLGADSTPRCASAAGLAGLRGVRMCSKIRTMKTLPKIIQGGMGAGVSNWRLAGAVSRRGHLGVVAGTALDVIMARRLQLGDVGGHVRRALRAFPFPGATKRILSRYFIEGGKSPDAPFRAKPLLSENPPSALVELTVAANFVEVYLAKEGHSNPVGINYLEKIQLPNLSSLYGAMLAGVGFVCMGAGIPLAIPSILDRLARGEAVELRLDVAEALPNEVFRTRFDPRELGGEPPKLHRPRFLAIVSSDSVASVMLRKAQGKVDGFVVEHHTAGGHNAPPRGRTQLDSEGQPIYGPRDEAKLDRFRGFGLPFWLAGSRAEPGMLRDALDQGATGIQVGTAFAFCEESGLDPKWKREILQRSRKGRLVVRTDPLASPTGFPFKVVELEGSLSEEGSEELRQRICDLGYLRHAYRADGGQLGWRCPGEALDRYIAKGGTREESIGRKCVCNGLLAAIGLAQLRGGQLELPILTAGDDATRVDRFLPLGSDSYRADDVLDYLLDASEIAGVKS